MSSQAFNAQNIFGKDNRFTDQADVKVNHTYSVMIARDDLRALFALRVTQLDGVNGIHFDLAVLQYGITKGIATIPGFNWTETNTKGAAGECFPDSGYPVLNKVCSAKVQTPYSCGGNYEKSAFYISKFESILNQPGTSTPAESETAVLRVLSHQTC